MDIECNYCELVCAREAWGPRQQESDKDHIDEMVKVRGNVHYTRG